MNELLITLSLVVMAAFAGYGVSAMWQDSKGGRNDG